MRVTKALLVAVTGVAFEIISSARAQTSAPPVARDLAEYRAKYPTHLTRQGPPPKSWQDPTPLQRRGPVHEVTYESGGLKLKAWMSVIPDDGKLHPAVVFCHGGFWFGTEDWEVLKPFLDAGFVVMTPRVRSENFGEGNFEYYYGEVNDVIAAGRFLAKQKGVDTSRLFLSGHSAGADLAALAAEMNSPYVLVAPIGGVFDMRVLSKLPDARHRDLVVFNAADFHEVEARSAMLFTASLRCPIAIFHGDRDFGPKIQEQFINLAHHFKKNATLTVVPGNHGQSLPNAIPQIIKLFQAYQPGR